MSSSPPTDPKLLHLVRKFVGFSVDGVPNSDHIVHCIRTQHREYQRKEITKLKRHVTRIIEQLQAEAKEVDDAVVDDVEEEDEDEEYEEQAKNHDELRSQQLEGSGLNANLAQRYRQMTQERDAKAEAEADLQASEPHQEETPLSRLAKRHGLPLSKSSKGIKRKRASDRRAGNDGADPMAPGITPVAVEAVPRPSERYTDLGGMDAVLHQIRQLVEYPLVRPELYRHLGVDPPRGVLLRGPPGCGKTHIANAIAGQLNLPYFRVSAPELVSGMSGESEARIRELFQAASDVAPSIIFLDELDAIAPKRSDAGSSRGMEKRMVAQLLTSFDSLDPKNHPRNAPVIVLAATNRSDSIDPALRRAGRFDKEILLGVPDEEARTAILQTMTKRMKLDGDFNYQTLARFTPGYVGADIRSLIREAAAIAIQRIFRDVLKGKKLLSDLTPDEKEGDEKPAPTLDPLTDAEMEPLFVTMQDFMDAIPHVQPSSKREGFATVPDVSWDEIGALGTTREELTLSILEPIRNPEKFKALGIPLPAGVMLYGPPGCGKTLLAKAIANESGANFISVKGPELLDKYVGESERSVRLVFERARASSPCVVFFDELDSLCRKRGSDDGGGGGVSERVVNQLLTEMDGLESRRSVFVIAATNRPELIDPAMMRPGRLDKLLYVPLPTPNDRVSILKAMSGKVNLGPDVDLDTIGRSARADGYSGADCAALLREAGLAVLKEEMSAAANAMDTEEEEGEERNICITARHFDYAFDHVVPSVSRKDQARYNRMRDRMAHARSRGAVVEETALEDVKEDAAAVKVDKAKESGGGGDDEKPIVI